LQCAVARGLDVLRNELKFSSIGIQAHSGPDLNAIASAGLKAEFGIS